MHTVAEVKGVCKRYGNTEVIRHCSFKTLEGEIYGLLGINGAGKTTLMKMILGLQRIDEGAISVLGRENGGHREYLAQVGSVVETPVFYEHLDAAKLLAMHLAYMGKEADIPTALRLVGLGNVGDKPISQYSLGMRQRLGLARAVIHRPKLLVLDEPLNGLDPIAIMEMRELLRKLAAGGMSILLSSHIIGEIRHTADRIGILAEGCIRQEFSVEEKAAEYGEKFEDFVVGFMRRNEYETV